jgi:HSP20 family molecular chaperone IbpA
VLPDASFERVRAHKVACEEDFVATEMNAFSQSLLLRLDGIGWATERAAKKGGDGFPPYNVERFAKTKDRDEILRITLAVAGFGAEELDISVVEKVLVIQGRQAEGRERTYLHQGIAARRFRKSFILGDELKVTGTALGNGLLSIDLSRRASGEGARTIANDEPE